MPPYTPTGSGDRPRSFTRRLAAARARRRYRRRGWMSLSGVGEALFGLVWMGLAVLFLAVAVWNVVDIVELRSNGMRTTGTALRTWTETYTSTSTDANGNTTTTTTTDEYTRVRFTDQDGATQIETVSGRHKPPSAVALVYHPGDPHSVRAASEVTNVGLGLAVFLVVFSAGFVLFGIALATDW